MEDKRLVSVRNIYLNRTDRWFLCVVPQDRDRIEVFHNGNRYPPDRTRRVSHTVLLVEDEPFIRLDVAQHLEECGYRVLEADNATSAMRIIAQQRIDVVFTDVRMPGEMDGLALARWVLHHFPDTVIMIASGESAIATAVSELCKARFFTSPIPSGK